MDVALVAIGSRGDVEPFLALGRELRRRGHAVRVATHGDSADLVRDAGLRFRPLPGSARAFFANPTVQAAMRRSPTPAGLSRALRSRRGQNQAEAEEAAATAMLTLREYVVAAVGGADVAVYGSGTRQIVAIAPLPVPAVLASWYPADPTRAFPAMGAPRLPLGGAYNLLTHRIAERVEARRLAPAVAAARRISGLNGPDVRARQYPRTLYLQSTAVVPRPDDWPAHAVVVGPCVRPAGNGREGPSDRWWGAGSTPVVVSFGSLWPVVPQGWATTLVERLRAAGHRLLLVGGPEGPTGDAVARCTTLDYATALPRAAAIVHHGGFGTGTAALRAGVPQVVVPLFIDHPWWAARMHELGVAPRPVRLGARRTGPAQGRRFAGRVAHALGAVDERMRERAAALAHVVATEDGPGRACDVLEEWVHAPVPQAAR